jgi:hypothetical protein
LLALNELRREALPMKGRGRGEPATPPPTTRIVSIFVIFPPIAANRIDDAPLEEASDINNRRSWTRRNSESDQSEIVRRKWDRAITLTPATASEQRDRG